MDNRYGDTRLWMLVALVAACGALPASAEEASQPDAAQAAPADAPAPSADPAAAENPEPAAAPAVSEPSAAGQPEAAAAAASEASAPAVVADHTNVGLSYTLRVDGEVVDSTEHKPPFRYVHGQRQLIPGLERELAGMHVGDHKQVVVPAGEGYGPADPNAVIEVPKTELPAGVNPAPGMILRGVNPDGQSFQATIRELKASTVLLDLNHPLAGKTLTFDVTVTDIQPAREGAASASAQAPAPAPALVAPAAAPSP